MGNDWGVSCFRSVVGKGGWKGRGWRGGRGGVGEAKTDTKNAQTRTQDGQTTTRPKKFACAPSIPDSLLRVQDIHGHMC